MRLNTESVALLRLLDAPDDAGPVPLTEAPKQLFEFGLVSRRGSGELQLTKTGARALFQAQCIAALESALASAPECVNDSAPECVNDSAPEFAPESVPASAHPPAPHTALTPAQAPGGVQPLMPSGVERWLTASGFLHATDKTVTAHGRLWLASLSPPEAVAPCHQPPSQQPPPARSAPSSQSPPPAQPAARGQGRDRSLAQLKR